MNNEKRIFTSGLDFNKLFIIFVIGCLFGNYYEMILNLVRHYLRDGSIFWEVRRGVIYGPFSTGYGMGAVLMTKLLVGKNNKWYITLIKGALLGGSFEYLTSFLQETFTGTTSWNYSKKILDINGRTTIPIMLLWGLLSVVFIHFIYPWLSKKIENIPRNIGKPILVVFVVFLSLDMFISFTAVIRQSLRREGYPAYTYLDEFYDKFYTDERLKKVYPNMKVRVKND